MLFPLITPMTLAPKSTTISSKRTGVSRFPRYSVSFSGCMATTAARLKKTREYNSCGKEAETPSGIKGSTAMEKEVLAVLGIARQGPIARYRRRIYPNANFGCTLDASFSSPPETVTAITPRTGMPTALTANPRNAIHACVPA